MKPLRIILFGATGDLFVKKILPALHTLYGRDMFPQDVRFIAYGRRSFTDAGFQAFLRPHIGSERFLALFSYVSGEIDDPTGYAELTGTIPKGANALIYAALPPKTAYVAVEHLRRSGIKAKNRKNGFLRILIEKPFGENLKSAKTLEAELRKMFTQKEIFRIDHYLAKNIVEAIPLFRKKNATFEKRWSKNGIQEVRISLLEKIDVSGRASFYDQVGAFLDVGQNHLLQMLRAVAAPPDSVLGNLSIGKMKPICAQYSGYLNEAGVSPESDTETYFSIEARVNISRWKGIPFFLRSGKALRENSVSIEIIFTNGEVLVFDVQPKERISYRTSDRATTIDPEKYIPKSLVKEPYEKLFADALIGKQNRFVSAAETIAEWKFTEKAMKKLRNVPLVSYARGSDPETIGK